MVVDKTPKLRARLVGEGRDSSTAAEVRKEALAQAESQPPDAGPDPVLRARIMGAQERLDRLSRTLDEQMHLVQAWIAGNKQAG